MRQTDRLSLCINQQFHFAEMAGSVETTQETDKRYLSLSQETQYIHVHVLLSCNNKGCLCMLGGGVVCVTSMPLGLVEVAVTVTEASRCVCHARPC